MLIAARNGFAVGKRTPTAKDYVQDGLLVHFDGIENVGYGLPYDNTSATWLDLKSGNVATLVSGSGGWGDQTVHGEWSDNCLHAKRAVGGAVLSYTPPWRTLEVVLNTKGDNFGLVAWNSVMDGYGICIDSDSSHVIRRDTYSSEPFYETKGIAFTPNVPLAIAITINADKSTHIWYKDGAPIEPANTINSPFQGGTKAIGANVYRRSATSYFYAVRAYSRELTAAEIAANYAVDKARFGLP